MADLYERKAFLVLGADLALEHPLLSNQMRANYRHHQAHIYAVTPGPVREDKYATVSVRGRDYEQLREKLQKEPELVILFDDSYRGDDIRKLVAFGASLGIPVQYIALVDYSNSRGAIDMGLAPELLPGYKLSLIHIWASRSRRSAITRDCRWRRPAACAWWKWKRCPS